MVARGRICTSDLWVMSPTSYYCSTPRRVPNLFIVELSMTTIRSVPTSSRISVGTFNFELKNSSPYQLRTPRTVRYFDATRSWSLWMTESNSLTISVKSPDYSLRLAGLTSLARGRRFYTLPTNWETVGWTWHALFRDTFLCERLCQPRLVTPPQVFGWVYPKVFSAKNYDSNAHHGSLRLYAFMKFWMCYVFYNVISL